MAQDQAATLNILRCFGEEMTEKQKMKFMQEASVKNYELMINYFQKA